MKTTNFWSLSLLAATLMVGGLSFNSCKKDEVEPVPEVVENPLEKEAYFITGKVTDGTNALEPGMSRRSVHLWAAPGGQMQ